MRGLKHTHHKRLNPESQAPGAGGAHASPFAGLHSNWVSPSVLAMARPWQQQLERHDVIRQFQAAGVGLVLNLQEVSMGGVHLLLD